MAQFNPDAYLAQAPQQGSNAKFDPDAYLTQQSSPQPQWSDLPANAWKEGKGIVQGLGSVLHGAAQYPGDVMKTSGQLMAGVPFEQTPVMQDWSKVAGAVGSIPGNVWGDIKSLATHPINTMIQKPISSVLNIGAIASPFLGAEGAEGGAISKAGQAVESEGNRMATGAAGIAPEALKKMNYANPAQAGSDVGSRLMSEGALGSTPEETLGKMSTLEQSYGKQVGDAINQIRQQGQATATPGMADPLSTDANPILKSTIDKATELESSPYSDVKGTAKPWREMYDSLASKAYGKDGALGFDDIRSEMQKVGKLFDTAKSDSAKYDLAGQMYGHLGQIRDQMVQDIASKASDPTLAQNLLKANDGYSFYSRLIPSARNMAALQGAGKTGLADAMSSRMGLLGGIASMAGGNVARGVGYLVGGRLAPAMMERMTPAIAKDMVSLGQGMQKYGPILQQAAVGGPRNLALVHSLLLNDPGYQQALIQASRQGAGSVLSPMEAGHAAALLSDTKKSNER